MPASRGRVLALAGLAVLLAAAYLLRRPAAATLLTVAESFERLGGWGPAAFTAAMTAAIPLCLPAAPFLLAAGVLFGPATGALWAALGNLLGGTLAFVLGRKLVRARVERRLASDGGFALMSKALRREGVRSAVLIRLSPVLPAWLLNYALGVSRIGLRDYLLSSVAILPTVLLYTLSGAGLGDLAALERGGGTPRGVGYYAALGGGIVATLAASLLLGRRARRIVEEMEE